MNKENIIRMAREAGFEVYETDVWITDGWWTEELEHFAALVAAAEREAIMEICNRHTEPIAGVIHHAIRARGQA